MKNLTLTLLLFVLLVVMTGCSPEGDTGANAEKVEVAIEKTRTRVNAGLDKSVIKYEEALEKIKSKASEIFNDEIMAQINEKADKALADFKVKIEEARSKLDEDLEKLQQTLVSKSQENEEQQEDSAKMAAKRVIKKVAAPSVADRT